jgi:hypothetical protein
MFFSSRGAVWNNVIRNVRTLVDARESGDYKAVTKQVGKLAAMTVGASVVLGVADEWINALKRASGDKNAKELGEAVFDIRKWMYDIGGLVIGLHIVTDWAYSGFAPSTPVTDFAKYGMNSMKSAEKSLWTLLDELGVYTADSKRLSDDGVVTELGKIAANATPAKSRRTRRHARASTDVRVIRRAWAALLRTCCAVPPMSR